MRTPKVLRKSGQRKQRQFLKATVRLSKQRFEVMSAQEIGKLLFKPIGVLRDVVVVSPAGYTLNHKYFILSNQQRALLGAGAIVVATASFAGWREIELTSIFTAYQQAVVARRAEHNDVEELSISDMDFSTGQDIAVPRTTNIKTELHISIHEKLKRQPKHRVFYYLVGLNRRAPLGAAIIALDRVVRQLNEDWQVFLKAKRLSGSAVAYQKLARTDALTRLPNRSAYAEDVPSALEHARRSRERVSLLIIDVNDFKKINDDRERGGHRMGDIILQSIAKALRTTVGRRGSVYRYGGDEFATLLPRTAASAARRISQQIRSAVELISVREVRPTVSIGAATYPVAGRSERELFEAADKELYREKANKKRLAARAAASG